jgi:hypothetical protein
MKKELFLTSIILVSCQESGSENLNLKDESLNLKTWETDDKNLSEVMIAGGTRADAQLSQHVVRLRFGKEITVVSGRDRFTNMAGSGVCTGVFVQFANDPNRKTHILSAGHCVLTPPPDGIFFQERKREGGGGQETYEQEAAYVEFPNEQGEILKDNVCKLKQYFPHPQYNPNPRRASDHAFDTSILEVAADCQVPTWIKPIPIAQTSFSDSSYYLAGFGQTAPNTTASEFLYYFKLPGAMISPHQGMGENEVIATAVQKNHHTCQGDSGGPLMVQRNNRFGTLGTLIGGRSEGEECVVEVEGNSFYSRLDTRVDWIEKITKNQIARLPDETNAPQTASEKTCFDLFSFRAQNVSLYGDSTTPQAGAVVDLTQPNAKLLNFAMLMFDEDTKNGREALTFLIDIKEKKILINDSPAWVHGRDLIYHRKVCVDGRINRPWALN